MDSRMMICVGVLIGGAGVSAQDLPELPAHPDTVVSRVFEHYRDVPRPLVRIADARDFHDQVWRRVQNLVGFRIHRPAVGGATTPDAVIYLSRTSELYLKAASVLRSGATHHEYVWCLLASILAHENAHTAPNTERQALTAELAQLRRCLFAGHLHASDGWNAATYLGKAEARLRNPHEHR